MVGNEKKSLRNCSVNKTVELTLNFVLILLYFLSGKSTADDVRPQRQFDRPPRFQRGRRGGYGEGQRENKTSLPGGREGYQGRGGYRGRGGCSDETAPRGRGGLRGRGQDNRSAPHGEHNGFAEAGEENGTSETPRVVNGAEDQEGEAPPEE